MGKCTGLPALRGSRRLQDDGRGRRTEQGLSVALQVAASRCSPSAPARFSRKRGCRCACGSMRSGKHAAARKESRALQLAREMEITHKSALFVLRRIRHGLSTDTRPTPKLTGTVEIDETYVGGKPRYRGQSKAMDAARKKMPVVGIVQRDGDVRFRMMERLTVERVGRRARRERRHDVPRRSRTNSTCITRSA